MIAITLIRKVKKVGDDWNSGRTLSIQEERELQEKIGEFLRKNKIMAEVKLK